MTAAIHPEVDRDAWLKARDSGLGSSDASAACGLNRHKSELAVYLEKRHETPIEDISKKAPVFWGNMLEEKVAEAYTLITGKRLRRVSMLRSKTHPFMLATLDREVIGEPRIVEIKTAGYWSVRRGDDWGDSGSDEAPIDHVVQVQHQMYVRGPRFQVADIALFCGTEEYPRIYTIPRDEKLIAMIIEREAELWDRILRGDPPPARSPEDALLRFPTAIEKRIAASTEIAQLVGDMQHLQRQRKEIDEKINEIKTSVQTFMGEADTLAFGDEPIAKWSNRATTSLDTKALKAQMPAVYEQFARRGQTRAFTLVESK